MQKKGQGAASAATLIAIIAFLILIYLLLIPPAERDKILGGDTVTTRPGGNASASGGAILLLEKPGTIHPAGQKEVEHTLPSFNLFTKTEDMVIKSVDSLYFESARGTTNSRKFMFTLKDPENTENAILSFDVKDRKGRLIIRINGEEILNEEVKGSRVIHLENLKESNEIEFGTTEVPFWQFWTKNFYDIQNIRIIASITDVSSKDATETVFITDSESENIDRASITYAVDCNLAEVGKLTVYLNGARLSSTIPDCGQLARHTINPEDIASGMNEFKFSAEKGTYLIDRVSFKTRLKEAIKPLYYFELNQSSMRQLTNNTHKAALTIKFVDNREEKRGIININGHKVSFDTRNAALYTRDITSNMVEGNNYIQLEPEVTLDIVEIKVEFIKK